MMKDSKILHNNPTFDVVLKDKLHGVVPTELSVVIMPFERNSKGLLKSIGVLKEFNPFRTGDYSTTLITGHCEDEDPNLLDTAKRELKEEAGFDVSDSDRWFFLGNMTTSKIVKQSHPCFAVDVTSLERTVPEGDGSEQEDKSEFMLVPVKEALKTDDCFIPTLFMKVFKYIYGFEVGQDKETDEERINTAKKRLDTKCLNVEGILGSLVRHDEIGDPYIEYTVQEITDYMKEVVPENFMGFNVVLKIAESNL